MLKRRCCEGRAVSAVLVTYQRSAESARIEDHLASSGFFREVLVWTNTAADNRMLYGRYLAAAEAAYEVVYTQDDDCRVDNIADLLDGFDGERLICGMTARSRPRYEKMVQGTAQAALLGWGAVFRREWIRVLDPYLEKFGADPLFLREADRVFTVLLNRSHVMLPAAIQDFRCAHEPSALWRQPDHWQLLDEAVRRAAGLLPPTLP
jgi:hypothetical protein